MEELRTDTLSDYGKTQHQDLDINKEHENGAANLLNGCEEVEDPLDLMDNIDNESIASNSDVWKGSDSEDENFEGKENSTENVDTNKGNKNETDKTGSVNEPESKQPDVAEEKDKTAVDVDKEPPKEDKIDDAATEDRSKIDNAEATTDQGAAGFSVIESEEQIEAEQPERVADEVVDKESSEIENNEKDISGEENKEKQPEGNDMVETNTEKMTDDSAKEPEKPADTGTIEKASTSSETENAPAPPIEAVESTENNSENTVTTDKEPVVNGDKDTPAEASKDPTEDRPPNRDNGEQDDDCQMDYDEDDDFDPSLLCPEVSMAVDDNPVVTTNGGVPNEAGSDSPLPYEPVFSTFVDEVTGAEISFNLNPEELELKKRLYGPTNPVQIARIHCTACNVHLGSALEGQNNRFVHPLLKVMICKECYHFYTSGEFEKDEDGSELYCRWCGQGGQVICCSKCEFVFCKRCIRTNLGRKKMFEIRDSDNWDCFRCNQPQILTQRILCYEFFEYVRREISRAATLNSSEIWSRDYSRCCGAKKRAAENVEEMKKVKKRKNDVDPDYNPLAEKEPTDVNAVPPGMPDPLSTSTPMIQMQIPNISKGIVFPRPLQFMPRYTINKSKDNDIEFVRQIPAPHVTLNAGPRPTYRTILPTPANAARPALQPQTLVRISAQPGPPVVPTASRILGSVLQNRNVNNSSMMKHEWFEKTVRAAARVNSHLSYTLTQLNKAQSQAASVEELAVVHNKLQEILSSSINSLIQIRKNLRTEFIAGIKTVRLPSKKTDSFNNDDDVIFVSAPATMPMPSTSSVQPPAKDPIIGINKSGTPPVMNNNGPKAVVTTAGPKGGYLKVKSVKELQNVPAECITIPDDTPSPSKAKTRIQVKRPEQVICNGSPDIGIVNKEIDPLAGTPTDPLAVTPTDPLAIPALAKEKQVITATIDLSETSNLADPKTGNVRQVKDGKTRRSKNNSMMYNLKEDASVGVKRMMTVKVNIQRDNLEELQKKLSTKK